MCGIAGMVGATANHNQVGTMLEAMQHRGPDGSGVWDAPGVSLGHLRLKIIDLSEAGAQPMTTPDGRYTITYNGEVYNYRELRAYFPEVRFRSETDTEVILYAYAKWGPACLDKFVGMFSLAIWDAHKRELFCARDRLGIKPFYFAQLDEAFVFASEIRALLGAGVRPVVNDGVLYDFLARDFYEHTNGTFFAGVHKLPAAHWMMVRAGVVGTPRRYWDLAEEVGRVTVGVDPAGREDTLLDLCQSAVDLHLRSDVPVGVALSGGLDSATLLALLDRVHPNPRQVDAFSFSFAEAKYSERPYVEAMARHTGREAHFSEVTPRLFTDTLAKNTLSQTEPYAGLPIAAYSLCFEQIRQHDFIVVMDGSGIDEILGGYTRFRPALWADYFTSGQLGKLEQELVASGVTSPSARKVALAQMAAVLNPQGEVGRGQDLTRSVRPECLTAEFGVERARPRFDRPFHSALKNLMYREVAYTKLPRALRFRDRLSMAVGTELRPPFLDHRLMAYAFALPADDLIDKGVSKAILRRAVGRLLPDAVRMASKQSVQTPQREWFRGELQGWVRERIDTPSFWQRGWVDETKGKAAMAAYFRGEGDNSFFLWQWLNLEIWAQTFIDGK